MAQGAAGIPRRQEMTPPVRTSYPPPPDVRPKSDGRRDRAQVNAHPRMPDAGCLPPKLSELPGGASVRCRRRVRATPPRRVSEEVALPSLTRRGGVDTTANGDTTSCPGTVNQTVYDPKVEPSF